MCSVVGGTMKGWLWLTTNNGIYRYDKKDRGDAL